MEEALIEMYLAGVSVRRVEDITEALWGSKIFYQRILLSSWVKDFTIRVKSAYVRLVIIGYGLRSQV